MKEFKIMLIYETDKRFIFPIDVLKEVVNLSDEQLNQLESAVLKEIHKEA